MRFAIILTIILCSFAFSQKKTKAEVKDTTITPIAYVQNCDEQMKQLNVQMRSQDWYEKYIGFQIQLTYWQGRKDLAKLIKDSVVTIPK